MFDDHFEAILADSEEAKHIHYKIRYQVYCIESGFEDRDAFPDGEEKDEWDNHSAHFIVRAKATGEWVAAMRLILPGTHSEQPVFRLCHIDAAVADKTRDSKSGEISRLCIINSFRRRLLPPRFEMTQNATRRNENPEHARIRERCKEPLIMLGLLRAAEQYSREHKISYWYFLTTRALARMIKRMNIAITKAGSAWLHMGERHPFLVDLRDAVEGARRGSPVVNQMICGQAGYLRYSQLHTDADHTGKIIQPAARAA